MAKTPRAPRARRVRRPSVHIPAVSMLLADLPPEVARQLKTAKLTDEQVFFFHLGYSRAAQNGRALSRVGEANVDRVDAKPAPGFRSLPPAPRPDDTVFAPEADRPAPLPAAPRPSKPGPDDLPYVDCKIVIASQRQAFAFVESVAKPEVLPEAWQILQALFMAWERGGYDRMPSSGRADIIRRLDERNMLRPRVEGLPVETLAGSGPETGGDDDASVV